MCGSSPEQCAIHLRCSALPGGRRGPALWSFMGWQAVPQQHRGGRRMLSLHLGMDLSKAGAAKVLPVQNSIETQPHSLPWSYR